MSTITKTRELENRFGISIHEPDPHRPAPVFSVSRLVLT